VQSLARFRTTLDFDLECLNGSRYEKVGKSSDHLQPLPHWMKKIGETLVHNKTIIGVHVDPPNAVARCF